MLEHKDKKFYNNNRGGLVSKILFKYYFGWFWEKFQFSLALIFQNIWREVLRLILSKYVRGDCLQPLN